MLFFLHWQVADPSFDESASQSRWSYMLLFSAAILGLAFAVPAFAGLLGGQGAFKASLVVAAGAVLSSFSNILEDGLQMKWAFFAFVLGSAIAGAGLLALTAVTAFRGGGQRILALVPAGTIAAIALYVVAGGMIMLVTWYAAAAVALLLPVRAARQPAGCSG